MKWLKRIGVGAAALLGLAVVIPIVLIVGYFILFFIASVPEKLQFTFRNDLEREVRIEYCGEYAADNSCGEKGDSRSVKPGRSHEVGDPSDPDRLTKWRLVDERNGKTVGCILLDFDTPQGDLVINASEAGSCRSKTPTVEPV